MQRRILIVEDDVMIAKILSLYLEREDYLVEVERDGKTGLAWILTGDFDLVILDRMLPGMDGLEICRQVRGVMPTLPILIMSARAGDRDKIRGLNEGADDYLTKPFSMSEMVARVRSQFRRLDAIAFQKGLSPQLEESEEKIAWKNWQIDMDRRTLSRGRKRIELTAREFDLMVHFAKHPGRVFSRSELLDAVWGTERSVEHTVNTSVNRLRAKIEEDPTQPKVISTVWGVGYKLEC